MIRRAVFALLVVLTSACAQKGPDPSPVVDPATRRTIASGAIEGFADKTTGAQVWRSLPFAAPPVGDLRWRAPRPPASWSGVRSALGEAPWCPQVLSALDGVGKKDWGKLVGQEDCLYLNVYAPPMSPDAAKSARLPVMMWIHGGSNVWGRAAQSDGATLAAKKNVIVVIVQYRLGALGWLAHPALRESAQIPDDATANFALLDHVRALEWIRDNAAAFGGDPSRVTVFGESAGGMDVVALLASPRAKGLFQRAIVQSGSVKTVPLAVAETGDADTKESARTFVARLTKGGPVTAATLRSAPLADVFKSFDTSRESRGMPLVIADGVTLPKDGIMSALANPSTYNAVPTILGTNRDEMKLFNALNPALSKRVLGVFPQAKDPTLYEAMSRYPSRNWRATAVDAPAAAMVQGGHSQVWTYRFDWDEEGAIGFTDLAQMLGAAHSMEIPFVFGHFQLLGQFDQFAFTRANEAGRLELSERMMTYWTQFAATGDPGGGQGAPRWAPFTIADGQPNTMIFDSASGGGVRMIADRESQTKLVADLFADRTLKSDAQRCQVFAAMASWNKEMRGMDGGRCR
jgi:para-nitrobenzyl esterase